MKLLNHNNQQILADDNEHPKFCPFLNRVLVTLMPAAIAGQPDQPVFDHQPCGSWCPHFRVSGRTVQLTCANGKTSHNITQESKS